MKPPAEQKIAQKIAEKIPPENQPLQWQNYAYIPTHKQKWHVNWIGLWTLYLKEVWRFFKVFLQTVVAPVINGLLFLAIFALALGSFRPDIGGISFMTFLAPGLIMMSVIQNAFANTSSSLLIAKIQGNIVDYLMPPLSPTELMVALTCAGITRGIIVAAGTTAAMMLFVNITPQHIPLLIFYVIAAGMLMSLIGTLAGIWSEKFDHLTSVTNFVILPLSFLSGTFYSVKQLPDLVYTISQFNPFFYMIDGLRYSFTNYADGDITIGIFTLIGLNLILWTLTHLVIHKGWRLKN